MRRASRQLQSFLIGGSASLPASLPSATMDRKSECREAQEVRERPYLHPLRLIAPARPCAPRCTYIPVGKKEPRSRLRGSLYYAGSNNDRSGGGNVRRLQSLRSLLNFKLHRLTFDQGLETIAFDGGEMHEHIFTTVGRSDKTETLGFVKPFNGTCRHLNHLVQIKITRVQLHIIKR